ncbi:hypothetical protein [Haloglycomyces albus]|uniref:hypothetical protein n=1 Tax=Haloglycomyces albus TaxID=526067 RepID=UPI00046D525F|nr:hypothetical protein [Haloglycomyces albus]
MSFMQRYAKWIALIAAIAMALPFISGALSSMLAMEFHLVALILAFGTAVFLVAVGLNNRRRQRSRSSEYSDPF